MAASARVFVRLVGSEAGPLAENAGGDRPGRKAVHANALLAQLDRGATGQVDGGRLRSRIIMSAQSRSRAVNARNAADVRAVRD